MSLPPAEENGSVVLRNSRHRGPWGYLLRADGTWSPVGSDPAAEPAWGYATVHRGGALAWVTTDRVGVGAEQWRRDEVELRLASGGFVRSTFEVVRGGEVVRRLTLRLSWRDALRAVVGFSVYDWWDTEADQALLLAVDQRATWAKDDEEALESRRQRDARRAALLRRLGFRGRDPA